MRKVFRIAFVLVLLFLSAEGLLTANMAVAFIFDQQYLPELTIKSDGTIAIRQVYPPYEESPAHGLINRTGNIYTLTADIEGYGVTINCGNVVFDGAGYTINASGWFDNAGLRLLDVTGVIVRNVTIIGEYPPSIFLVGSKCLIANVKIRALEINGEFNNIAESNIKKLTLQRGNNFISECNISQIFITGWSSSNKFTKNLFLCDNSTDKLSIELYSTNFWDNGSVGNYWIDYLVKYPNASEIGNTGIGDTPYVLDQGANVDNYPLMYPYDVEKDEIALPTPELLNEPETEPLLAPLIAGVSAVSVIGVAVGLFCYHRHKRKL